MTERPGERQTSAHTLEPGGGLALWVLGSIYTFKARGRETGGAYAIVEATVSRGRGPRPTSTTPRTNASSSSKASSRSSTRRGPIPAARGPSSGSPGGPPHLPERG